jgi:hypothetical protein
VKYERDRSNIVFLDEYYRLRLGYAVFVFYGIKSRMENYFAMSSSA